MEKDFTPSQVRKGEVDYSLEEFLNDLWEDVKSSVSKGDFNFLPRGSKRDRKYDDTIREIFYFYYEICYLAAIKKSYLKITLKRSSEAQKKAIKKALKENKENINMLHAIFRNQMARELNKGLTKKQAAKVIVEHNKDLICNWNK